MDRASKVANPGSTAKASRASLVKDNRAASLVNTSQRRVAKGRTKARKTIRTAIVSAGPRSFF